jgi:hypothetical protein
MSVTTLNLPALRTYGNTVSATIGTGIAATAVSAGVNGGLYLAPFQLPLCFDPSYPSTLTCLVTRLTGATPVLNGTDWQLMTNHIHPAHAPEHTELNMEWPVTLPWQPDDPRRLVFANTNGCTFDPHTFDPGDIIGIRLARTPTEVQTRFERSILIPQAAQLTYTQRCFHLCVP